MSESEKKKRGRYRKNREKWIFAQSVIIAVVAIAVIISALVSYQLNKKYYIGYTESGSIRLANKEFQIMEMLLKNPGHVITSDCLMERIWGLDGLTEMNVIWVYISYLRRKLLTLGADITIKSIRNSGYTVEMAEEANV